MTEADPRRPDGWDIRKPEPSATTGYLAHFMWVLLMLGFVVVGLALFGQFAGVGPLAGPVAEPAALTLEHCQAQVLRWLAGAEAAKTAYEAASAGIAAQAWLDAIAVGLCDGTHVLPGA